MNIAMMSEREELISLMQVHQANVWRYLRMLGCERSQADDLTQETFLQILEQPFEQRSDAETGAYLRSVARHLFLNMARRQSRSLPLGSVEQAEEAWARFTPEEHSDRRIDALNQCIDALEQRDRRIVELHYRERVPHLDIAAKLKATEDAVKS